MELAVQTREKFGKASKSLRIQGLIPAELYGHGAKNLHLSVAERDFKNVFREAGESTVIELVLGEKRHPVLIYDVSRDYLTGAVNHIDFYEVRMDEKLTTHIPIELTGASPAVKEKEGILTQAMAEIEVEALPGNLPHSFVLDISGLADLNQSLYVKDLNVPAAVRVLVDPETAIVSVSPPKKEEEIVPPLTDVSQVKVETEEKKLDREKEKEKQEKPEGETAAA